MVKEKGGESVPGWSYEPDDLCLYARLNSHVVWRQPDGRLVDITPCITQVFDGKAFLEIGGDVQFVPDPEAWEERNPKPPRYIPLRDDPRVKRACEYLERSDKDRVEASFDSDKCRYWTARACALLSRVVGIGVEISVPTHGPTLDNDAKYPEQQRKWLEQVEAGLEITAA
jgi:hypothetical protein